MFTRLCDVVLLGWVVTIILPTLYIVSCVCMCVSCLCVCIYIYRYVYAYTKHTHIMTFVNYFCSFCRRGLTDELGAEAMMMDALEKVEKELKKPLLRNDKKGMALLLAEFDKVNQK